MSEKTKAFKLFNEGFTPDSPEVQELDIKRRTLHTYFYEWQHPKKKSTASLGQGGAVENSPDTLRQEGNQPKDGTVIPKGKGKVMSQEEIAVEMVENKKETPVPPKLKEPPKEPEVIASKQAGVIELADVKKEETKTETPKEKEPPKDEEPPPGDEEEKPKTAALTTVVYGSGIRVVVEVSTKTLNLYNYAATKHMEMGNPKPLLLGDFFDDVTVDFFRGRGLDLGLVEIGGEKENE